LCFSDYFFDTALLTLISRFLFLIGLDDFLKMHPKTCATFSRVITKQEIPRFGVNLNT